MRTPAISFAVVCCPPLRAFTPAIFLPYVCLFTVVVRCSKSFRRGNLSPRAHFNNHASCHVWVEERPRLVASPSTLAPLRAVVPRGRGCCRTPTCVTPTPRVGFPWSEDLKLHGQSGDESSHLNTVPLKRALENQSPKNGAAPRAFEISHLRTVRRREAYEISHLRTVRSSRSKKSHLRTVRRRRACQESVT